jgi:hypothetical protein
VQRTVTPSPGDRADAEAIARRRNAPAGWAAFRVLRRRPAPVRPRRHGNLRHGRYAKGGGELRRLARAWRWALREGTGGEPVAGLRPPPKHPG